MTFNEFASERAYKGSNPYPGDLGGKINEIKNYYKFLPVTSQQSYKGLVRYPPPPLAKVVSWEKPGKHWATILDLTPEEMIT